MLWNVAKWNLCLVKLIENLHSIELPSHITILPFFSKLVEKLLGIRLTNYFSNFNLLTPHQFEFRSNYCPNLFVLIEIIDNITWSLDKGLFMEALFIDFIGAFDTINHNMFFLNLIFYVFIALSFINGCLSNCPQVAQFVHVFSDCTIPGCPSRCLSSYMLMTCLNVLILNNIVPFCMLMTQPSFHQAIILMD